MPYTIRNGAGDCFMYVTCDNKETADRFIRINSELGNGIAYGEDCGWMEWSEDQPVQIKTVITAEMLDNLERDIDAADDKAAYDLYLSFEGDVAFEDWDDEIEAEEEVDYLE